jgi:hypothetical protein
MRPADHTKLLRTHCALPCSMWLQPNEGTSGRRYFAVLLLLLLDGWASQAGGRAAQMMWRVLQEVLTTDSWARA